MDDEQQTNYSGAETTGFQSPAQDYIEELIDLGRILDLRKPGIYPVRVRGQAMLERGIRDGADQFSRESLNMLTAKLPASDPIIAGSVALTA